VLPIYKQRDIRDVYKCIASSIIEYDKKLGSIGISNNFFHKSIDDFISRRKRDPLFKSGLEWKVVNVLCNHGFVRDRRNPDFYIPDYIIKNRYDY
jgi:hypothetical protein